MRLFVMRHGPAEDHAESGRDEDRALTASGRDRVRGVAKALLARGELPVRIVTSPLVRTVETTDIVVMAFKAAGWVGPVVTAPALAPADGARELVRALCQDGRGDAMVVGHEPDLSNLVEQLTGEPSPMPMDKAMVVVLDGVENPSPTIRFILEPRSLQVLHQRDTA